MQSGIVKLGPVNALYPSLTTIVGAYVDGRANFCTVAHVGIMNHGTPQYISVGMGKVHHTNKGIHAHKTFSVNVPHTGQMVETDYVGIKAGKKTDKSTVFEHYDGETGAPCIAACPVVMDCRLERVVDFPTHDVFVGEIIEVYAHQAVLSDGKIDVAKADPLLFDMASVHYYKLGEKFGPCWNVGKQYKEVS